MPGVAWRRGPLRRRDRRRARGRRVAARPARSPKSPPGARASR